MFTNKNETHRCKLSGRSPHHNDDGTGDHSNSNATKRNATFTESTTSPRIHVDPSDVDSMMANELYRMSFQDRTELEEEIHGVHSLAVTETPELIEESMDKFQRELDATPTESKHAYQEAMTMNITSRHFVQDRKLRLKFLRAELFDAPKAVRRFVLYLDGMKRYFGPSALERPLQYSDMGKAEQDTFKAGVFQILPSRDRAGRLVLVGQGTTTHVSVHTKTKVLLYIYSVMSDDVETQKLGHIFVVSADDKFFAKEVERLKDPEDRRENMFLMNSIPVRTCAIHFCLPNDGGPVHLLFWALWMLALGRNNRVRARLHNPAAPASGGLGGLSSTEVQHAILSFGVNIQELPITSGGQVKTKNHLQWIKTRKAIDEGRRRASLLCCLTSSTNPSNMAMSSRRQWTDDEMIVHPGVHDVLLVKGGSVRHWGNIEFQGLLASRVKEYINHLSRSVQRKAIRAQIIKTVHDRLGRFLVVRSGLGGSSSKGSAGSDGSWWVENTDLADLDDRISTALYDLNRKLEGKANVQMSSSVTAEFAALTGNRTNYKRRKLLGSGEEDHTDTNCNAGCDGFGRM